MTAIFLLFAVVSVTMFVITGIFIIICDKGKNSFINFINFVISLVVFFLGLIIATTVIDFTFYNSNFLSFVLCFGILFASISLGFYIGISLASNAFHDAEMKRLHKYEKRGEK